MTNKLTLNGTQPNPEVSRMNERRKLTANYKLWVVEEADKCSQPGEIGSLLRREGLYSSQLATWRRQREAGQLAGLKTQKRGRKTAVSAQEAEVAQLKRENEQLKERLRRADLIIEAQKKLNQLLDALKSPVEKNE